MFPFVVNYMLEDALDCWNFVCNIRKLIYYN